MNRSFLYGDGFFETMRIQDGEIPLLGFHLSRAKSTAVFLEMNWPKHWNQHFFVRTLLPYTDDNQIVRITFYRNGEGTYTPNSDEICFEINHRALPTTGTWLSHPLDTESFYKQVNSLNPYLVEIYSTNKKPISNWSRFKTTSSIFYVKAGLHLRDSKADDLILLNDKGRICEGLSSNVLIFSGDKWISPEIGEGSIEGTYLSFLNTFLPIERGQLEILSLNKAELILLVNAAQGIRKCKILRDGSNAG